MSKCIKIDRENGSICLNTGIVHQPKYIFMAGFVTGLITNYVVKKSYNCLVKKICDRIWKKK